MSDRVVSYDFRGKFTNLTGGLAAAGKSVHDLGDKMTALDKQGVKTRAGLKSVGDTAGKIGLVAAAGLGAIVVAAANFDKAMSGIQAATHETAGNMEELRAAALKAGADTAFSASEAAAGIENLAKAGVATKDILAGGLSGALDLAAAGQLEVADAAEIAATALTQFKLAGEDIPHVADLLAAGAGKAQGSVSDMGMALKQSGLVAAQTGLTIEETTGTLAAFASAGLIGSDAGTSFKTMLQSLTPTGDKARDTMEKLGISAYDTQGNFVGMTEFAASLKDGLKNLSVEQQNAAMKTIFGSDAVRAASVIFQQGESGIQGWIDKVNDSGYAAETAGIQMDNLSGDLEAFKGSLETALIGAGEGSQGPLRSLVQDATKVVNAFNDMPPAVQGSVTKVLAATALLGGGLFVGAKIISGIASTKRALAELGVQAGKTRSTLLKVGGATAGFLAVTAAAQALNDALNNDINTSDLDRDLKAIARGETTDSLNQLTGALEGVNEAGAGTVNAIFKIPGALVGVETSFSKSKSEIEQFDQALAAMVESGKAGEAAALFERIIDATLEHGGVSAHDAVKEFDSYSKALNNVTLSSDYVLFGTRHLTTSTKHLGKAMGESAEMTALQKKALQAARGAASDTAHEFVGLGDSVDDAKVSLGKWLRQLEEQADALRNFRVNAEKAGKRGLREGLIAELEKLGPAGALRMKQLANATDTEIKRANRAWKRGQDEIRKYTNAIGGVQPKVDTKVNLNTDEALSKLNYFASLFKGLNGDAVTTHVKTIADRPTIHKATGGPVFGPGSETSDSIPAMLSTNEHVWSAREVRAAGGHAALERMRMKARTGQLPHFRDGGAVGHYDAPRFRDGGYARHYGSSTQSGPTSMVVTGTLQTPWGPAHIEGIARDVARQEIDSDASYHAGLERMNG